MSTDDTKLYYSSEWDIDQLVASDTVIVATGTTPIYTITGSPALPAYEVQFQPNGSAYWYSEGRNSSDGTLAGEFDFSSYIGSGSINITTGTNGTARYFVWSDKVNY